MNTKSILTRILDLSELTEKEIIAVYPYGSRVYGTANAKSDYDYIVVHNGAATNDAQQYDSYTKDLSVHTYHADSWQGHLDAHKIFAIECYSMEPQFRSYITNPFNFMLDKPTLRKEISSKSSNSWVKCKKKLTVETDEFYIGIKSLFHSFRIPIFGIQIAKHGKVIDFTAANHIWEELKHLPSNVTWDELNQKYKLRHNELMTQFRIYAEKI